MDSDQKKKMRRRSMLGTVLLAAGIIAAVGFAVAGSVWAVSAAVVFVVAGVVMLYQVGKSLS